MPVRDFKAKFEAKTESGGIATFTAIASTPAVDSDDEVIEPGAFLPVPAKPDGTPDVMLLRDHDRAQVIGGWTQFSQVGNDLVGEGALCLEVAKARETHALMKSGWLSGVSVAFPTASVTDFLKDGRRHIAKATLKECSIVAFASNSDARVTDVKASDVLAACGLEPDDAAILIQEGLEALIEARQAKDPQRPFGDVEYADPGYQADGRHRYPIDTEARIRAAWSYINVARNQAPYTADQVSRIKAAIIAAWKRVIHSEGPPAARVERSLAIAPGDTIAVLARKFAEAYEIPRRSADAALDALKAALREDQELRALKAALGIDAVKKIPDYSAVAAALDRLAGTVKATRAQ